MRRTGKRGWGVRERKKEGKNEVSSRAELC